MGHIGHCGVDPAVAELNRYLAGNDRAAAHESAHDAMVEHCADEIVRRDTRYRISSGHIGFQDLTEWIDGDELDAALKQVLRACDYVELVEARSTITEVLLDAAKRMVDFHSKSIVIEGGH